MTEPFQRVVQFEVPRSIGKLLDPHAIRDKAKAAGIARGSYEYSTYRTQSGGRITAQRELVPLIAEAFIEIAEKSNDHDIRVAAARASKAALDALHFVPRDERKGLSDRERGLLGS